MKVPPSCNDRSSENIDSPELMLKKAWEEFETLFPRKEDCLAEVVRILLDSGLIFCRECKQQHWEKLNERVLRCIDCKTKRSVTAGTFFDHMRSYQAWLAAIWFVDRGIILNSAMFQRTLKIAHSSARFILKRVMTAMKEPMGSDEDTMAVPTEALIELFRRRSFETEAGKSPKSEQQTVPAAADREPHEASASSQDSQTERALEATTAQLPDDQKALLKELIDEPLSSDQLSAKSGLPIPQISACLSMLEMDGLCTRLPGNQFRASSQLLVATHKSGISVLSDRAIGAVRSASQFIGEKYNGVSRKHLQKYLIAHWVGITVSKRGRGAVLEACLKLGKKTSKEIFNDVTPAMVLVAAPKLAA